MSSINIKMKIFHALLVALFTLLIPLSSAIAQNPSIEAIFQFGDSLSDTGNMMLLTGGVAGCAVPPYGQTYFHRPTGRCSDGLLIVDFLAKAFNLPLLSPYLDNWGNFSHGVNFAVAGATAINPFILASKYSILATATRYSLQVQLDWFKSHLAQLCYNVNPTECKQKLENALFIVGTFGGVDYGFGAFGGRSIQELQLVVPEVVQTIINVVKELIDLGAKQILVPGDISLGCLTNILVKFRSNDPKMYDEFGCLKYWNDFANFHNVQLQGAIKTLQQQNPVAKIVYGDFVSALKLLYQNATSLGFNKNEIHKACCGIGDDEYNFTRERKCGTAGVKACPNPNTRVTWDGFHWTQNAHQFIADQFLKQITTEYNALVRSF